MDRELGRVGSSQRTKHANVTPPSEVLVLYNRKPLAASAPWWRGVSEGTEQSAWALKLMVFVKHKNKTEFVLSSSGFLDSEHLKESDEEVNLSSSILTEEEREEILQELGKVCVRRARRGHGGDGRALSFSLCVCVQLEEEIGTLRQVLSSKEKQHADLKQKLGINPLSEFRNNFSRGWRDVQTSVA